MNSNDVLSERMVVERPGKSAWPAILDLAQGVSGLLLAVFVAVHLLLEASILISLDAMYSVTKAFEGVYFFGEPYPIIVSLAALLVFAVFVAHAALAMRKFPASYRQYHAFHVHRRRIGHTDTRLWMVQVHTGFVLFFIASAHLLFMVVNPDEIGPYASADRVWSGLWAVYLLMLIAVVAHAGIGVYRLAVKWNWFWTPAGAGPARRSLLKVMYAAMFGFLVLSLLVLFAYMRIGYEHREQVGERYVPLAVSRAVHGQGGS